MAFKGLKVGEAALPYVMAALAGSAAALMVLLAPQAPLEQLVGESGLPAVLGAAEPPLGATARALLAGFVALLVAAIVFSGLSALEGLPGVRLPKFTKFRPRPLHFRFHDDDEEEPLAAPPPERRRPIFARADLGESFDSVTTAKPIEVEWTEIEAAPSFAPVMMPGTNGPSPAPCASGGEEGGASLFERMRPAATPPVFDLPRNPAPPPAEPSLVELVRRLEAGMERRRALSPASGPAAQPDMDAALRDALGTLQRMAGRARG